jgi:hypothetical protein
MATEICENCGRQIGNHEQAYVCTGSIVCNQCNKILRPKTPASSTRHSEIEKPTARQIAYAKGLGITLPENVSKAQLSCMIDACKHRAEYEDVVHWFVYSVYRHLSKGRWEDIRSSGLPPEYLEHVTTQVLNNPRILQSIQHYNVIGLMEFGPGLDASTGSIAFKEVARMLHSNIAGSPGSKRKHPRNSGKCKGNRATMQVVEETAKGDISGEWLALITLITALCALAGLIIYLWAKISP